MSIRSVLAAIREDCRTDYLFDTKIAANAVGWHPNKFGFWWFKTKRMLIQLYLAQPGELAAELAALIAEAEMLRSEMKIASNRKKGA
jgi:hypothetical protein